MRIALATDWFLPRLGGIELHLRDLGRRLVDAGHEVVVVTSTPAAGGAAGDPAGDCARLRVVRLDAPRLPIAGVVASAGALDEIREVLTRERVDIVHSHISIVSPVGYGSAWAARRLGLPVVTTFHSVIPGLRTMLGAFAAATRYPEWGVLTTSVSSMVKRAVEPLGGASGVRILPNGIDAGAWRANGRVPASRPVPSGGTPLMLVSAMRLVSKKRPAALLRLIDRVRRDLGPGAVHLSIAGDGRERGRLERSIRRMRLEDSVALLGRVDRARLQSLYARSDLFVLPTRLESFGLAALEARAAGLPVAAMAGTGVADFIRDDVEGWLAASDSDLAGIVMRAATDRARLERIAEHNRRVPPPFDWDRVLRDHLAIYEEAMSVSGGSR